MTSLSQRDIDGGLGDFQRSKMRRLARREVKDETSDCKELMPSCTSETPNIAIKGFVFIWVPRARGVARSAKCMLSFLNQDIDH